MKPLQQADFNISPQILIKLNQQVLPPPSLSITQQKKNKESVIKIAESNQIYLLNHNLLSNQKISSLNRYKMLKYLMEEVSMRKLSREVFALSCYYFDLYLQKESKIDLKDLQFIGISCFLLAAKVEQGKYIKLVFPNSLNLSSQQIELKIMQTLNYFLHPVTYITLIDTFAESWDNFIDENLGLDQNKKYLKQNQHCYLKMRTLYNKMEYINLNSFNLKFNYNELTFNLFFLQNKIFYNNLTIQEMSFEHIHRYLIESYEKQDQYFIIFSKFTAQNFSHVSDMKLLVKIGFAISSVICFPTSNKIPSYKRLNFIDLMKVQSPPSNENMIMLMQQIKKQLE